MAVELVYESRELQNGQFRNVSRRFSTEMDDVEEIVPNDDRVVVHANTETLVIPFNRVFELAVDLDEETVSDLE